MSPGPDAPVRNPSAGPPDGLLFVVSGPSGAGKTVLCNQARERLPGLVYSISATSRPPRGEERDGVDYFFRSREEMQRQIAAEELVEWAEVHGNFYGTPRAFLAGHLAAGRAVLLNIDVQGAQKIRARFPRDAVMFFIMPPSLAVLEERLRARHQDGEEAMQRRLANARLEMAAAARYDHIVVNDDLGRAAAELVDIMRASLARRREADAGPGVP